MAKTIDEKVVQLGIDNKAFGKGVEQSLKDIDTLEKGLKFSGASKGLGEVSRAINDVSFSSMHSGIDSINSKFSVLGAVAFTIIQDITRGILDMGKNIANAIVLDPIKTGLQEYETQINAIQTILANTSTKGTTMSDVTGALDELNTYADKTIYNFTEMTRNIGTFTAAGVDLDTSVAAIKGIANLAAVSGSNSQQASTAMYQLSQALSSGSVKLQDWNSVVNAGMGGQIFQDNLKETARAHGIAIDDMIAEQGSFRETLSEGWLSSEILLESLSKFTGDLSESQILSMGYTKEQAADIMTLGQMANDAATKVKTFTQLQDTLKEAMQSGWTQTWGIVIGDFDEARDLFTDVSDMLGGIIGESAASRNNLLSMWKGLGGRDVLIQALYDAFDGLFAILDTVKEAMNAVFPPLTAERLFEITKSVGEMFSKFKMAAQNSEPLKLVLKAIFSIIDIGIMFVVAFVKAFRNFLGLFAGVKGPIGDAIEGISKFVIGLRDSIKEGKLFDKFFKGVFDVLGLVIKGIAIAIGWVVDRFKGLKGINLAPIADWFKQIKLDLLDSGKLSEWFSNSMESLSTFISGLGPKFTEVKTFIKNLFSSIGEWFSNAFKNLDFSGFTDLFHKGMFGELLSGLEDFAGTAAKVGGTGLFLGIINAIRQFIKEGGDILGNVNEILEGVGDTLKAYQQNLQADSLQKIATAIAILAVGILVLSLIDPAKLGAATLAIGGLFAGLMGSLKMFEKVGGGMGKMSSITIALIGTATAIMILAGALLLISLIEPEKMLSGVLAIGGLLAEVSLFLKATGGGGKLILLGIGMNFLALGLALMAGTLTLMSLIPWDSVVLGLKTMGLTLLAIGIGMRTMPKNLPITAVGLIIVAQALAMLVGVLYLLGLLDPLAIQKALVTLAASLLIIGYSMRLLRNGLEGAISLKIIISALNGMAKLLKRLGKMDAGAVAKALIILATGFALIGGAAYVLTPVIPAIQGLGVAILILGAGLFLMGAGMAAFATALVTLAGLGAGAGAIIIGIILAIAATIPIVAYQLGKGLVMLFAGIAEAAPQLLVALGILIATAITALVENIPRIVEGVMQLVTALLTTLAENLPTLIDAGVDMLLALLQGFEDNIGRVVEQAVSIVSTFLRVIGEELPKLVDAGFDMLISVIDGIADTVSEQLPRLIQSVKKLGVAIIDGIVQGITGSDFSVVNAIADLGRNALASFKSILGIDSPSKEFTEQSKYIGMGIIGGIEGFAGKVYDSIIGLGKSMTDKFASVTKDIAESIDGDFDPTITPVLDLSNITSGTNAMQDMLKSTDLQIGAAIGATGSIANNLNQQGQPTNVDELPEGQQQIVFNQYNTSTGPLSRLDLYRQTNYQLRVAKGVLIK